MIDNPYTSVLILFLVITYSLGLQKSHAQAGPFRHGVASGDPMPTKVIIWTKITPAEEGISKVKWLMAKDSQMKMILKSGEVSTSPAQDYTVKIDVQGLSPATVYYYMFQVENQQSVVGKTKTAPAAHVSKLKFAVVSCSNYAEGYFSAFGRIADRTNLDGVIHLGDYIYEGTERDFDKRQISSIPHTQILTGLPKSKEWWLSYYRERYAISHLDSNLSRAHQQHPFITVWDDHETADNAYKDGANGHNPSTDGKWEDRKAAAKQAYFEWMPIRGDAKTIYRSLSFGNLMELILLDTRLEGRDKQIYNASSPDLLSASRSLLGTSQKQWLLSKLKTSAAQWKVIGSQVIFSPIRVGWAKVGPLSAQVAQLENNLLDYWSGYPAERDSIMNYISTHKINNVVMLSASMHCALAADIVPALLAGESNTNSSASQRPIAVEFASPSISSANFDEKIGSGMSATFESLINQPLPPPFNFNPNPHLKFVDLDRHGYYILTLTAEQAQADWYFVENIFEPNSPENFAESWFTPHGKNALSKSAVSAQ